MHAITITTTLAFTSIADSVCRFTTAMEIIHSTNLFNQLGLLESKPKEGEIAPTRS